MASRFEPVPGSIQNLTSFRQTTLFYIVKIIYAEDNLKHQGI